ncbi:unnamed protein product [Prorocentrum cordatum]|uniref:RNA-directed RNA polymerase n=1 Tax=Prorocentrum cordatum TaxID=2364126 RepID=A0ABN9WWC5_9DINO|nr:unnamed protein product [Polarella glacialis]
MGAAAPRERALAPRAQVTAAAVLLRLRIQLGQQARVEDASRKAHKEALNVGPEPGSHPQPRRAWARQKLAPWEHDKLQRQDSELAALRQQVEAPKADSAKAKLTALSDLKVELWVKAVEAKYSEPPKLKSPPALEGQRRKLEGQHQKALAKIAELEDQRAKLDQRIFEAKDSAAELKSKLQAADAEIESRHAAGALGDGLRGMAKAVLQGLIQLQGVVKKEQETLDAADDAAPGDGAGDGAADPGSGDPHEGTPGSAGSGGESVPVPDELVDSLMEDAPEGESLEQRRKRFCDIIGAQLKRPRRGFDFDLAAGLSTGDGPQSVSGGVGIGVRQRFAAATFDTKFQQPHRVLRRVVNIGDGLAIDFMSIYLRDGEGMNEANADILWEVASQLRVAARPWILAGGFSMDPHSRAGALNELDYAVISDELQQFVFSHGPVVEAPIGPHSPVLLEVRGLHADATVQRLHRAARLPFDRAIGCLPWVPLPAWTWEEGAVPPSPRAAMQEWLRHAGGYLLPLHDLHGDEAQKSAGRADGARFVDVSLADASRRRWAQLSSHETHAWGGLVNLLQRADLLVARGKDLQGLASLRARLAALRLADYDGSMAPVPRGELGAAATSRDATLRRRLIEHARAQLQANQRSDAAAARRQWQAWAKGSASGGGKLAHRFSKPEPLAKATLVMEGEDEGDALPVNGDEAVRHCLKEWLPLWLDPRRRGGLEEAASWGGAPEPLPSLEVDSLRYLLKRYGRWAGLGWDQLHPRQLLLLDESFLARLHDVLASWEDGPEAYLDWLAVIVFRAKADGGRRPIAPTCLQIRLWSALRGPIVRAWEAQHHEVWCIGGEPNTCERAGWAHQTLTALAYEKGLSTGTAMGDLRKFYENISHKELLVEAQVAAFYPSVRLGSVVDDFTLQTVGTTGMVKAVLGPAMRMLLGCFDEKRVPVHFGKLCYLTPDAEVAKQLESEWPAEDGRAQRGRLLGNDVHDGRWRRTAIGAQRVEDALARSRRLQVLRSAGAKVATVQRGGPTAAATWGSATTGLAPSVLHGLRVAAARGEGPLAPGASVGLQLRCFPKGIDRDPAVVNAGQVVLQFGMALWLGDPTPFALTTLLEKAQHRFSTAKRPWATCRDPVAAFFLTISRLGWSIEGGRHVTTDQGLEVDLARVSPYFSKELAEGAAKRWSDRDATYRLCPHQSSELHWGSLQRLGRTKESLGWQQHQRAALHSVISGTVLSQTRLYKRGMASEWDCLMCRGAPGTLWHRLYGCDGHAAFRKDEASPELLRHAVVARAAGGNCGEMFGRCLFPSLDHVIPRRDPDGDPVRWYRRPASGYLTGFIFTDGSAAGTRWPELQRAGWSLAQCDRHGRLIAAAWGWVPLSMAPRQEARDGEDYAFHMAAFLCEGHVDFQTDCAGTVACAQRGAAWACRPGSARAHMWNAFYASFDGSRSYTVTKALAHATAADVEADRTTWWQRAGNRLADEAAKEGAKLALADDQLDLAYGLDLIARQAMIFTGKLHARMADRKLLDHASDVILELSELEAGYEEHETSGGHAAEASWGAAGAAAVALAAARAAAEGDEPPAARRPRRPWTIGGHSIVERAVAGPGTDGATMVHFVRCYAYAHQRMQGILGPRGTGAGREPQIDRIRRGLFPNVKGGRGAWRLGEQRFPPEAWRTKFSQRLSPAAAPEASRATGSGQQGPAQRLPRSRALLRFGVGPEQEADFLSWSARQRGDRRSKGDPDELEGEASD